MKSIEPSDSLLYSTSYPGIAYGASDGKFWKLSYEGSIEREIMPNDDALIFYTCAVQRRVVKKKAILLAYEFLYGSVPANYTVYAKDCNLRNTRGYNLGCIPKELYKRVKDALDNIRGSICLIPHKKDAFVYFLRYRKDAKVQMQKYHDIVSALQAKDKIYAESVRLAGKYLVSA